MQIAPKLSTDSHQGVSARVANTTTVSKTPRIITLGGDHTTTLAALRSTYTHWGAVSVIHFDSHIGKLLDRFISVEGFDGGLTCTQTHGIQKCLVSLVHPKRIPTLLSNAFTGGGLSHYA